jgi:hypothetical protein
MPIDRQAFESALASRSPLTPSQFEQLIGELTAETKSLAWQLMKLPPKDQYAIWHVVKAFPQARVERIR